MLHIQTFDQRQGGNVLYKALAHPLAAEGISKLYARLAGAGPVALYDPDGIADPLFAQFLRAGYARLVAPVRPGFEKAVMHYIRTKQIWSGEELPVIGDPLYVSIIEELTPPVTPGRPEASWQVRLPTTMVILQDSAEGVHETGLPCNPEGI